MASDSAPVLRIEDLHAEFRTKEGTVKAVSGASLDLRPGEVTALVGESGSGKSTLGLAALNLVSGPGRVTRGRILFHDRDLLQASEDEWRRIRGRLISIIFQDPTTGLNPILTIGSQVAEILTAHQHLDKKTARREAVRILHEIGLADAERVAESYPFQVSGGMAQRVMIGIATALDPEVIIADEPTSALDVTIQASILNELDKLRQKGVAILLITHDFGVVAQMAQRVSVMYAGRIVEQGTTAEIFRGPRHPYTRFLLSAMVRIDDRKAPLPVVPGVPPSLIDLPDECPFLPRCPKVTNECRQSPAPPLAALDGEHLAACYNPIHEQWAAAYR